MNKKSGQGKIIVGLIIIGIIGIGLWYSKGIVEKPISVVAVYL